MTKGTHLMDRNTALGAAAGVTLAVVGAVSALFLTIDQPAEAASPTQATVVEYIDQYGNPVAAPGAVDTATVGSPEIVLVNPDGSLVETVPTAAPATAAPAAEYEAEEYEEEEYEEHEEEEYEEHEEEEYEEDEDHDEYEEEDEEDEEYEEDDD